MEKQSSFVNVKTSDGRILLSLYPAKGLILEGKLDDRQERGNGKGTQQQKGGNGSRGNGDDSMTFPQKRLLFRLMAQEGVEGDEANNQLLKLFQVNNLKEVGKLEASRMIDHLLKEVKGEGGDNGGIPF